jgi:predicted  nucleic acid-binding Zn-ribbon protein
MNQPNPNKTAWHLSREVTISTLMAIALAASTGLMGYADLKSKVKTIQEDVKEATEDRIRKDTVVQMFANKDLMIQAVAKDVEELHQQADKIDKKIDKLNDALILILSRIPE